MAEWIEHYNGAWPHRGPELGTPIARSDPVSPTTDVCCRARLGRLLRDYSSGPAVVPAGSLCGRITAPTP